ncbi:MAG: glycosyltransferase [Lachnospiraceae bacterium]
MKIAMVFDGLGMGGIERVGIDYVKLLLRMGHEVDIYNTNPNLTEMEENYPKECRIYHKSLSIWLLPDQYILMVKRWWWGKYAYPVCYLGAKILQFFYRFTMGIRRKYDLAIAFSGHFSDMNFVSSEFIKSDKKLCWLHGALLEYLAIASTYGDQYRKFKNLCVLSEANQKAALNMNRFLTGLNIKHIYNPIDLTDITVDEKHVSALREEYGDFLLMVARFEDDKDQESVIRAYKILKECYGVTNKLVFAGSGSTLDRNKKLAESLGLENDIVFVGNRTDVEDYYAAAKICVHSSPAEGLPTVLLEAMKYGTPIVATRSMPGVEEILKGNTYGLQCEVGNPQDIADKIIHLLKDEKLQQMYIEKGKIRIQDFSYDRIMSKLETIFNELI